MLSDPAIEPYLFIVRWCIFRRSSCDVVLSVLYWVYKMAWLIYSFSNVIYMEWLCGLLIFFKLSVEVLKTFRVISKNNQNCLQADKQFDQSWKWVLDGRGLPSCVGMILLPSSETRVNWGELCIRKMHRAEHPYLKDMTDTAF